MSHIKVLWVDDEIDLLKPHIMFLEKRNYHVTKAKSGTEAIEEIKNNLFDIECVHARTHVLRRR